MNGGPRANSAWGVLAATLGLLTVVALGCVLAYQAGEWWLRREPPVPSPLDWSPRSFGDERTERGGGR